MRSFFENFFNMGTMIVLLFATGMGTICFLHLPREGDVKIVKVMNEQAIEKSITLSQMQTNGKFASDIPMINNSINNMLATEKLYCYKNGQWVEVK